jgi:hypothetical protein
MARRFPVRDGESSGPQPTGAERVGNRRLATPEASRLGTGGLLGRVDRILRIDQLSRLIPVAIGITWIPLLVLSLGAWWFTNQTEPILKDLSIHVRLLVSLPLLLVAERVLDRSGRRAVARLFDEDFVPPALEDRARAIVGSAERWRDSPLIETVLLLVAIASGVASLLGILPAAGIVHGVVDSRASAAHFWYALVSLPVFQFVFWRSLFHWGLWVRVLGGLSRVPLRLLPMHADRRGGISFLKQPSIVYGAVLLLAMGSTLCAGWGTKILLYGSGIDDFKPLFYAFVLIATIIAFAPLLMFVPQLFAARREGRRAYGGLVTDYARALQERWIGGPARKDLLGSPDFQSLADLGTSYSENVQNMQVFLFSLRDIIGLFIVSHLPAIPVLLLEQSVSDVIKRLVHVFVGV